MYIASSSTTVKFHDFPDGCLVHNYQPGTKVNGPIKSISWSKDGTWLSLVPTGSLAEIISIRNQLKLIHTVVDIEDPTCSTFQNTTKKFLAYGTQSGHVLIYDIKSKSIKTKFPKNSSPISHIEFTAADSHLAAGCTDGTLLLYSSTTNALSFTSKIPHSGSFSTLRTNPIKRNYIAAGSYEGTVVVWDVYKKAPKFYMQSHAGPVTGIAFSPINSDLLLSTGTDRQFFCYDVKSGKCITQVGVDNAINAVDFLPDGTRFILGHQNGNIGVYDARRVNEPVSSFRAHNSAIKSALFQKQDDRVSSNESDFKFSPQVPINEQFDDNENSFLLNHEIGDIRVDKQTSLPQDSFIELNMSTVPLNATGSRMSKVFESVTKQSTPLAQNHSNSVWEAENPVSPIVKNEELLEDEELVSPIVKNKELVEKVFPVSELKKVVREAVREQLEETARAISNDIKYQLTVNGHQMERTMLNVHVGFIKEFIKVENMFCNLRDDLAANNAISDPYLLEENLLLKKQVALLEKQLAVKSETNL